MPSDKKVALVTGANGITGAYMVAELCKSPLWSSIIAVSRSPSHSLPSDPRLRFERIDLTQSATDVETALKQTGVTNITHFYHFAYIHSNDFQKMCDDNVPLFTNTLTAVEAVSEGTLERVVLQTGAKHYGVAFRPPDKEPITEDIKRADEPGVPPNFYYGQEDFLFALQKGKSWTWNVTRPFIINGYTKGNGMSWATTAALYFTMKRAEGKPAIFPASKTGRSRYTLKQDMSSSSHIAKFTAYISTNENAGNEAFNIVDADPNPLNTFGDIWEWLGSYFNVDTEADEDYDLLKDVNEMIERGVWEKTGGSKEGLKYATWEFFVGVMKRGRGVVSGSDVSMDKAKEFGWTDTADTRVELDKMFGDAGMRGDGVICWT